MPVKKDANGRRSVEAEVEVPGTPEQVWQAIATGPGISSWFVPTKLEEREGGATTSSFGPGMDSLATITVWDQPRRFVAETKDELGPNDPPVATEWTVEARSGGTCVVRVVHSWFASTDDWDKQFEGHSEGWRSFFRILRLYLAHFTGQSSACIQLTGFAPVPKADAWAKLTSALGLKGAVVGKSVATTEGAPPLGGLVERVGEEAYPEELLVRLDKPGPGISHLFAMEMGGQVLLSIRLFLYGNQGQAAAGQVEPQWQAWVSQNFPPDAGQNPVC